MSGKTIPRKLTDDDWKAFAMAFELLCQISQHGRGALLPFAQAIVECEK